MALNWKTPERHLTNTFLQSRRVRVCACRTATETTPETTPSLWKRSQETGGVWSSFLKESGAITIWFLKPFSSVCSHQSSGFLFVCSFIVKPLFYWVFYSFMPDFGELSKKLAEVWKQLPEKDKLVSTLSYEHIFLLLYAFRNAILLYSPPSQRILK